MLSNSVLSEPNTILCKVPVEIPTTMVPQPTRAEVAIGLSLGADGTWSAHRILEIEGHDSEHCILLNGAMAFTVDSMKRELGTVDLTSMSAWLRNQPESSMKEIAAGLSRNQATLAYPLEMYSTLSRAPNQPSRILFTSAVLDAALLSLKGTAEQILSDLTRLSEQEEVAIQRLRRETEDDKATRFLNAYLNAVQTFRKINLIEAESLASGTWSGDATAVSVRGAEEARIKLAKVFKDEWPDTTMPHKFETIESFLFPKKACRSQV